MLYLVNENMLDGFEYLLNTKKSVEDIRQGYYKLLDNMDANMAPLLHDISRNTIYLQDIQNKLNTLKHGILSDIVELEEQNEDGNGEEDVIQVDWDNGILVPDIDEDK